MFIQAHLAQGVTNQARLRLAETDDQNSQREKQSATLVPGIAHYALLYAIGDVGIVLIRKAISISFRAWLLAERWRFRNYIVYFIRSNKRNPGEFPPSVLDAGAPDLAQSLALGRELNFMSDRNGITLYNSCIDAMISVLIARLTMP